MTRVGLLEDDIAIQEMMLLVLQDEGYTVVNYPDAETCLLSLGITGTVVNPLPIDLLIADWRLSGPITGVEVIRQLRAKSHLAPFAHLGTLPVILTTAATYNDTEELQQLQVSLLEKPFSVDDIIHLIQHLLISDTSA